MKKTNLQEAMILQKAQNQVDTKKFMQEAGIDDKTLKQMMYQIPPSQKRQTRQRNNINYKLAGNEAKVLEVLSNKRQQFLRTPKKQPPLIDQASNQVTPTKQPKPIQQPKTPRIHHPHTPKQPAIPIPKSVDQFYQSYISYSKLLFKQEYDNEMKWVQKYKQCLYELLTKTLEHNGIITIVSEGYKDAVFIQFLDRFNVKTTQEVFNVYKKYLFHFEFHLKQNYTFKEYKDATGIFHQATFISEQQLKEFIQATPLDPKYFKHDIIVFRNGQQVLGVNSEEISLDNVSECYKNYNIDIRIQKALDYGFKPKTLRNQPYQMKISKYRTYQKLCQQYGEQKKQIDEEFIKKLGPMKDLDVNGSKFQQRVKDKQIFFGVNFDPDDGILVTHIADKVKGTFLGYKQEFDLLSYLDHQIPGCSFPQFYMKVRGVWTGGHQENVNMCAVNINHGPDSSQWYTMEYKYVQQFRAQLKKEHKMDLYGSQGLWYEKINWFVEQGKYPIKKIIQKKGDIVISGPGTLHWVRSYGIALQSAWNLFPITYNSMEYAYHRQEQNQRIKFIRTNVIPLKSLTLKFLNHQSKYLTRQIAELCVSKLKMWYDTERKLFQKLFEDQNLNFGIRPVLQQRLDDLQGFCSLCRCQILLYFLTGKEDTDIVCLNCFTQNERLKKKNRTIYMRHAPFNIQKLILLTQLGDKFQQIQSFCNGPYVGKIPVQCPKNRHPIQKSSQFTTKINQLIMQVNEIDQQGLKKIQQQKQQKRSLLRKQQNEQQQNAMNKQSVDNKNEVIDDKMDLQQPKNENKDLQIIQEQKSIKQHKYYTKQCHVDNGVKYYGSVSPQGWWNFQIPYHLKIVSQDNYVQLLKLIDKQIYHRKKTCLLLGKHLPQQSHWISFNRDLDFRDSNRDNNRYEHRDRNFTQRESNSNHYQNKQSYHRDQNEHRYSYYDRNRNRQLQNNYGGKKSHQHEKNHNFVSNQNIQQASNYNPQQFSQLQFSQSQDDARQNQYGQKKIHTEDGNSNKVKDSCTNFQSSSRRNNSHGHIKQRNDNNEAMELQESSKNKTTNKHSHSNGNRQEDHITRKRDHSRDRKQKRHNESLQRGSNRSKSKSSRSSRSQKRKDNKDNEQKSNRSSSRSKRKSDRRSKSKSKDNDRQRQMQRQSNSRNNNNDQRDKHRDRDRNRNQDLNRSYNRNQQFSSRRDNNDSHQNNNNRQSGNSYHNRNNFRQQQRRNDRQDRQDRYVKNEQRRNQQRPSNLRHQQRRQFHRNSNNYNDNRTSHNNNRENFNGNDDRNTDSYRNNNNNDRDRNHNNRDNYYNSNRDSYSSGNNRYNQGGKRHNDGQRNRDSRGNDNGDRFNNGNQGDSRQRQNRRDDRRDGRRDDRKQGLTGNNSAGNNGKSRISDCNIQY